MLSEHDTELLARIGPGTPMGTLFRRFWIPVLLSDELPEPGCPPVAVRILGEDLVAFRDTEGKVGVLEAYCAHRHAHLYWGRNEDCGLRCTYHGWMYDIDGNCIEMPNELEDSDFKDRIKITSYPARDWGGVIWAYMGPAELMPPEQPQFEWARVADSHRIATKRLQESNWAQAVEGGIDSSHVSFLHRSVFRPDAAGVPPAVNQQIQAMTADKAPRFWISQRDFGFLAAAQRRTEDDKFYWRITPYLTPMYTIIPGLGVEGSSLSGHAWVPIDDEHVWTFTFTWNPTRPITAEERETQMQGFGIHTEVDKDVTRWDLKISNAFRPVRNAENNYMIDREEQRTRSFTGIKGISEQDMSIQESMGKVSPRWKEHLGTTDKAILEFRRLMLAACRNLMEGKEPPQPHNPDAYRARSAAIVIDKTVPWEDGSMEAVQARV